MNYTQHRFLLMTLDPVHIGTGGFRLGRVDNSIVREPGTNLPKIPGTSLSGAIRTAAAYRYESSGCAGQGEQSDKTDYQGHCGEPDCPICYTFGSLKTKTDDGNQQAYAGVINICDAHLLFFPVHSMAGPVWVSTAERLNEFGFEVEEKPSRPEECILVGEEWSDDRKTLNLRWLMLEALKAGELTIPANSEFNDSPEAWNAIKKRLVLVTEKVFIQVVNSNLEVRTSVAIDPVTGAASEGALFTYEAIPRTSWLVMDVVEDDYRWRTESNGKPIIENGTYKTEFPITEKSKFENNILNWNSPVQVIRDAFNLIEILGVGGMGTRGFGRIRQITEWEATSKGVTNE